MQLILSINKNLSFKLNSFESLKKIIKIIKRLTFKFLFGCEPFHISIYCKFINAELISCIFIPAKRKGEKS